MALLDEANTSTYGHPVPTKVTTNVDKGPFIVISGHDLYDLKMLLLQTEGKGKTPVRFFFHLSALLASFLLPDYF